MRLDAVNDIHHEARSYYGGRGGISSGARRRWAASTAARTIATEETALPWIPPNASRSLARTLEKALRTKLKQVPGLLPCVRAVRQIRTLFFIVPWLVKRRRAIKRYLADNPVAKLQIGAGTNQLESWLNTDSSPRAPGVLYLNALHKFPVRAGSFSYVFTEHQIEHLDYFQGQKMLRECFIALRPGGTIRIATPSLDFFAKLVGDDSLDDHAEYVDLVTRTVIEDTDEARASIVVNNAFRAWGHRFLYDRSTMRAVLERAGFVDVRFCCLGQSTDPALRGIEGHGHAIGCPRIAELETMVAEARRPANSDIASGQDS